MHKVLLFGPQGSGKGTQGVKLSDWLKLPLIVTGNIFREHMKNATALGTLAKQYINQGQLVPDEVTNQMIADRLRQTDCAEGFILDGFPRNLKQAEALDQVTNITHLLHITISDVAAIQRISERRTCIAQGHVYHMVHNPPKQADRCDIDGSSLQQREDDTAEALKKRLAIYHAETELVLSYYQPRDVVRTINGEQPIEQVWTDIQTVFA